MKTLLKNFFVNLLSFTLAWQYFPAIVLVGTYDQLILAAIALTLLDKFLRPLLRLISFPLRFVTFGLFDIVITVGVFYLTTYLVDGLEIVGFTYSGFVTDFLIIPELEIVGIWTYVVSALVVVLFNRILGWVFKTKKKVEDV